MNYTLRNIIGIVLFLFVIVFGYYYLFSRQQGQYIPAGWEDFDCMSPVFISSDSFEPTLRKGSLLILNQCVNDNTELEIGNIVSFTNDGIKKVGIIEDITYEDREISYTVQISNDQTDIYNISKEDILAYTEI
ncbi:S26 family signal peptidase [Candidatus Dojkabacteria bacterium]|nr:S26 family signal peptidase [Candidatus Dojkabacteria bacterium]